MAEGYGEDRVQASGAARSRGPKDYLSSDEHIREDVCERLLQREELDVSDVTVAVRDGRVMLAGTVPERHMKHAIEDEAAACHGVQDVDNDLRVRRPAASPSQHSGARSRGTSAEVASGEVSARDNSSVLDSLAGAAGAGTARRDPKTR